MFTLFESTIIRKIYNKTFIIKSLRSKTILEKFRFVLSKRRYII